METRTKLPKASLKVNVTKNARLPVWHVKRRDIGENMSSPLHETKICLAYNMNLNPATLRKIQQWTIIITLGVSSSILWLNALNSGIAKLPVLLLGSTLAAALFLSSLFSKNIFTASFSIIELIVALHIPLFFLSAVLTFKTLYTLDALSLGAASLVFYFAGTSLFTTKKEVSFLLTSIEVLTTVLCVVGFVQYFFGKDLPLDFFLGENNRIASLLGNSTYFAAFLLLVFPLIASRAMYRRSIHKSSLYLFLLLASTVFLLFKTQTRSSIIALGISLLVFFLLSLKKNNATKIVGLMAIVAAAAALWIFVLNPALGERFMTMFDENQKSTFARRMFFWGGGTSAFAASPLTGHGIGGFEQTVLSYRSPDYWTVGSEDVVPHAHNELIEISVEYGVVGLVLCVATIGFLLYRGISIARKGKGWEQWTAIGLTCSIIGIAVDSLANVALRQAPIAALVWLLMGLLSSQAFKKDKVQTVNFQMPSSNNLAVLTLIVWILLGGVYTRHQLTLFNADIQVMNGLRNRQKNDVALRHYEAAVALNPTHLFGQSILTLSRLNGHRWKEGLESLQNLNKLSPLYPKSSLMKAYALYNLGKYPEALAAIQQELRLRTHPESYDLQARILREMRDDEQERNALLNLLRNDIKGKIDFKYQPSCLRLLDLSTSIKDREEAFALFDSLEVRTSVDPTFFQRLKVQRSGQ